MSLLHTLLFDPYRIDVWIAKRTDNIKGSGTQSDPYNGATAALFDGVMSALPSSPPLRVHLGPGEFETQGFYQEASTGVGWQLKPGMKIVGSGIDVTTIRLTGVQDPPSGTRHYYAVGHLLATGGVSMDYAEISDLTIDCNLTDQASGNDARRMLMELKQIVIRPDENVHLLYYVDAARRTGNIVLTNEGNATIATLINESRAALPSDEEHPKREVIEDQIAELKAQLPLSLPGFIRASFLVQSRP